MLSASWLGPSTAADARVPPDFEDVPIVSGLTAPTAVAWAPDGRMFVAEKAGRVRVVSPDGVLRPAPLIDISDHVNSHTDRGLLGIAVDSDFEINGFLYLLYVYETDVRDQEGPKVSRLTRIEVTDEGSVADASNPETVILGTSPHSQCPLDAEADCIPADHTVHSIGTVRADRDGSLWVGNGEALWSGAIDDPRAFRPYDERSYAGKILHVDRQGRGLPGHPFCPGETDLSRPCTKLYAKGFRNPFRFSIAATGGVTVGDVGWETYEEINNVLPGRNYGWPCYEGTARTPSYEALPQCAAQYSREGQSDGSSPPLYQYARGGGASVLGAPAYAGDTYPAKYRGAVFVADTIRGFLRSLHFDPDGRLIAVEPFGEELAPYPVDLVTAPNGDLVYVSLLTGTVRRIAYAPNDKTPVASAHATPTSGRLPLKVDFSGAGSADPDGTPLTYRWDFGDGSAPAEGAEVSHTYTAAGTYTARLTVTDAGGRSAVSDVRVFPGNEPPEAAIRAPADGNLFRAGRRVALEGEASDPDDGVLSGQALTWDVVLHHGDHVHELTHLKGPSTTFLPLVNHDADSWYEVTLTATDSGGLRTTRTVRLYPETIAFRLDSVPPGAPISYAGRTGTAPMLRQAAIDFRADVSAAERFERDGRRYEFERWTDGGSRAHVVVIPAEETTLTAHYRDVGPVLSAPPPTSSVGPVAPIPLGDRRGPSVRLTWSPAMSRNPLSSIAGRARDPSGVIGVQVALGAFNRRGRPCSWWSPARRRLVRSKRCGRPRWMAAQLSGPGTDRRWRILLGRNLPAGNYVVEVQARDRRGNVSKVFADGRRSAAIRVRSSRGSRR